MFMRTALTVPFSDHKHYRIFKYSVLTTTLYQILTTKETYNHSFFPLAIVELPSLDSLRACRNRKVAEPKT